MRTIISLAICIISCTLYPFISFAWDSEVVHPLLSEVAVINSTINSTFSEEDLGLHKGINEVVNGKKLNEWIRDGAEYEDNFPRFRNHFHNPMYTIDSWNQAGLDDFWFSGQSSVLWAQDASSQASAWGGDWSWAATRQSLLPES